MYVYVAVCSCLRMRCLARDSQLSLYLHEPRQDVPRFPPKDAWCGLLCSDGVRWLGQNSYQYRQALQSNDGNTLTRVSIILHFFFFPFVSCGDAVNPLPFTISLYIEHHAYFVSHDYFPPQNNPTLSCSHKLDRSRVLMVGDRQDTDVAFANACSVRSLLVFTGVTHEHEFKDHHDLRTTSDPAKLLPFLMTPAALTTPQTVHSSGALLTPTTDEMLTPLFVAPSVNALAPEIEAKYSNAVAEMVAKPAPSNVILSKL